MCEDDIMAQGLMVLGLWATTVYSVQYNVLSIVLYSVQYSIQYSVQCTVQCTQYSCSVHSTVAVYTVYSVHSTVQCAQYSTVQCIWHSTVFTLQLPTKECEFSDDLKNKEIHIISISFIRYSACQGKR